MLEFKESEGGYDYGYHRTKRFSDRKPVSVVTNSDIATSKLRYFPT